MLSVAYYFRETSRYHLNTADYLNKSTINLINQRDMMHSNSSGDC